MKSKFLRTYTAIIVCLLTLNLNSINPANATVNTNSSSTLQVDFGASSNLTITGPSTVLTNVGQYLSRPTSGWSDTDTVAIEISITDSSSDTATVATSGNCYVDLSSSTSSQTWGTNPDGSQTITGASGAVFLLNDNSAQLSIEGQLNYITESLAYVKVGCDTQSLLASKYLRMGAVPSLPSSGSDVGPLYYLFSTQHYYRYMHDPNNAGSGDASIVGMWNYAKSGSASISVDGTNHAGVTRFGWPATVATPDEVQLTKTMYTLGAPMIGTTDYAVSWAWDAAAWGGTGTSFQTAEANFKWLGPDEWGKRVPTMQCPGECVSGSSFNAAAIVSPSSRYWKLSSNEWNPGTSSDYTIDLAACVSSNVRSSISGLGIYQNWNVSASTHSAAQCPNGVSGYATKEPNGNNGDGQFVYQAMDGTRPVWDDSSATYLATYKNMYVEYCSPANPCPPPDIAAAEIKFRSNQTISISSGPAAASRVSTPNTSITAYSTSGLQLTYTIDTTTSSACSIAGAPLTVDSGTAVSVSMIQANTNCTVNINQSGDGNYYAASQVQLTFTSGYGIVASCSGVGSLINGDFENLPGSLTQEASNTYGNEIIGSWHGYGGNSNPKQILFVYGASDTHTSTYKLSGWNTTATDGYIEIQRVVSGAARTNGTQGVDTVGVVPASGNYHAELAARQISTLYQDVATLPGSVIRWSLKHRARATSGSDTMQVKIGTTSIQTVETVTARRTPTNNVYLAPTYSSSTDSGYSPSTTISTSLADGWREYRAAYTVPAGQTTTRFAFVGTSGTSVGNLLDDIKFSPLVACPASFSVVAGRSATINPFDINNNNNTNGNDSEDSYGWSDAFVTDTITATAGSLSRTSANGVSNRAMVYDAPTTPGTYSIDYTISNPQGDLSNSRYTVTVVPDSKSRAPSEVPLDPRTVSYNLKLNQVTSATTSVLACIQQSDSGGSVISGALQFDIHTSGATDSTATYGGSTVTFTNDRSNYLRVSGPIDSVNLALVTLRISRTDTPARLSSTFYIRFSSVVTGLTLYNQSDCSQSNSSQIKVLKLRPIKLTQIRSFSAIPKNGRQNN